MKKNREIKIIGIIKEHLNHNKKEYMVVTLIFIIGIFLGVLFINHIQEVQKAEITNYLTGFMDKVKNIENLNYMELLKNIKRY